MASVPPRMNLPSRTRHAVMVALLASALVASAQAQTVAPAPPPPAAPAASAPPPVWTAPPALPEGARFSPIRHFTYDATLAAIGPATAPEPTARACPDGQLPVRVVVESLAGTAVTAAAGFISLFAREASSTGGVVLGTLGALATHLVVSPAAVVLVGNAFEGHGRYWSTVLGNVLLPVVGGVLGYELSHDPVCREDAEIGRAHV